MATVLPAVLDGRYEFIREAAAGGMGRIMLARDRTDGAQVAIKLTQANDIEAMARFAREARLLTTVKHPCIVRMIDHGMIDPRSPFIVCEWLDGPTVGERIAYVSKLSGRPTGLAFHDCAAIGARVASALSALRVCGIVHRDVKAANVVLAHRDPRRATLIDFGAARAESEKIPLTVAGTVIGTPSNLAPEQTDGRSSISSAIDIWGLGILLYHAVTGVLPFQADRLVALMLKIVTEQPKDVRELRPDVPPRLYSLINACLEKKPDNRPDAETMLGELMPLTGAPSTPGAARPMGMRESMVMGERDTLIDPLAGAKAVFEHKKRP